ncbi:hypothetical protein H0H92_010898 [Tricholoma furcatifolium]|nr:hypothetical protein H0H92_010898 [Tricholoma furcatifolium]
MSRDGRNPSMDPARPPVQAHALYTPLPHEDFRRLQMANASQVQAPSTRPQPTIASNSQTSYYPSTSNTYSHMPAQLVHYPTSPTYTQPPSQPLSNSSLIPMNESAAGNFAALVTSAVKTTVAAELSALKTSLAADFKTINTRIDSVTADVTALVNNLYTKNHSQVLQSLESSQKAYKSLHADIKLTKDRADRSEKLLYAGLDRNDKESLVSRLENVQYNVGELVERLKDPQAHDLVSHLIHDGDIVASPTVPVSDLTPRRPERAPDAVQRVSMDQSVCMIPNSHRSQPSHADVANDTVDLHLDLSPQAPHEALGAGNDATSRSNPLHEGFLLLEHALTDKELVQLLFKPEPQRIKIMFVAKPDNVIAQAVLWNLYKDTFLSHGKRHPLLGVSEFLNTVIAAFPDAKATVVDGPVKTYIIWGVKRREDSISVDSLTCHCGRLVLEHTLTKKQLDSLVSRPEPWRCREWLKAIFMADPDGDVPYFEFWDIYNDTFDPYVDQYPLLSSVDIATNIDAVFPQARTIVIDGHPQRYLIRGIKKRQIPVLCFKCSYPSSRSLTVTREPSSIDNSLDARLDNEDPTPMSPAMRSAPALDDAQDENAGIEQVEAMPVDDPVAADDPMSVTIGVNSPSAMPHDHMPVDDPVTADDSITTGVNVPLVMEHDPETQVLHASSDPIAGWFDYDGFEDEEQIDELDDEPLDPTPVEHTPISDQASSLQVIESSISALRRQMECSPGSLHGQHGLPSPETTPSVEPNSPVLDSPLPPSIPPETTPSLSSAKVVVTVSSSPIMEPVPRLATTQSDVAPIPSLEPPRTPKPTPPVLSLTTPPRRDLSLGRLSPKLIPSRPVSSAASVNSGICSPPPRFKALWRTSSQVSSSSPRTPGARRRISDPVPDSEDESSELAVSQMVAVGTSERSPTTPTSPEVLQAEAATPEKSLATPTSPEVPHSEAATPEKSSATRISPEVPQPETVTSEKSPATPTSPEVPCLEPAASEKSPVPEVPHLDPVASEKSPATPTSPEVLHLEPTASEKSPATPTSPEVQRPEAKTSERLPAGFVNPQVLHSEATTSERLEEPLSTTVLSDSDVIMVVETPVSPVVPDPEPNPSTTHSPGPVIPLFIPESRPESRSPLLSPTIADDAHRESPKPFLHVQPTSSSPRPSQSRPDTLRTPSKLPVTVFSPNNRFNRKGAGSSPLKGFSARMTPIKRKPQEAPIVLPSSPIYISSDSSRASSPLSESSPSDSDSSDAPKVVRQKHGKSKVKKEVAGPGFEPAPPRINLKALMKAKSQPSGATTRVKKRKIAPTLAEMQPPLKRAKQKIESKEEKSGKVNFVAGKTKGKDKEMGAEENEGYKPLTKLSLSPVAEKKLRPRVDCANDGITTDVLDSSVQPSLRPFRALRVELAVYLNLKAELTEDRDTPDLMDTPLNNTICARPDCNQAARQPDEFFMTAILGRRTKMQGGFGRIYEWLVKWDGYPIKDCTWEEKDGMSDPAFFIDSFYRVAAEEGHDPDKDPHATILLREAIQGGWKDSDHDT